MRNSKTGKFNFHAQAEWLLLVADLLKSGFSLRHAIEFSGVILKDTNSFSRKLVWQCKMEKRLQSA